MTSEDISGWLYAVIRMPFTMVERVYQLSLRHKERNHWHAYYAIPVLIGFLVTYLAIQLGTTRYPDFYFGVHGYHIHHYTYGIAILLVFGYVGLWTQSLRVKYFCALAHGVAAAFIIDETWLWFSLNPNILYTDYDLAVYVGAILLGIILAPLFFDGITPQ